MKGTKQISIETKNMTESARKLLEKVENEPDIDDQLLKVIEDFLKQSEKLESYAGIRLVSCLPVKKRKKH